MIVNLSSTLLATMFQLSLLYTNCDSSLRLPSPFKLHVIILIVPRAPSSNQYFKISAGQAITIGRMHDPGQITEVRLRPGCVCEEEITVTCPKHLSSWRPRNAMLSAQIANLAGIRRRHVAGGLLTAAVGVQMPAS